MYAALIFYQIRKIPEKALILVLQLQVEPSRYYENEKCVEKMVYKGFTTCLGDLSS